MLQVRYLLSRMTDRLNPNRLPDPPVSARLLPLLTLTVALLAVSCAAIFIRFAERELTANALVFNRLAIATLAFGALNAVQEWRHRNEDAENFSLIAPSSPRYTLGDGLRLVAVAAVSSASVVFWAESLTETSVANSTLLRNLTPLFTSLGGWLLLGQRFDRRFLLGTAIAVGGAIAIGFEDVQLGRTHLIGDGLALLSALFYGANLLLVEGLRSRFDTVSILLWRCGVGALLMLPLAWGTGAVLPQTWQGWLSVAALAIVCQVLGQGLLVYSLKQFSSGFVAVFLLLEPLLTAVLAWAIFAEALDWTNALAFAIVLLGIYLARSSQSASRANSTANSTANSIADNPSQSEQNSRQSGEVERETVNPSS